jgi:ABC-type transporter Mla subunit MlaD
MADPSRYPDSKPDATRRWVKVVVIIAIVVVLLVVVMMLAGGGVHKSPVQH